MTTPDRTTAEVFPRYTGGEVLADSAALKWPGLFARRYRFPRVLDGFLVPATEFFGRDETLAHLSFACAEMLAARTAGHAKRVAAFAQLLASYLAEQYTNVAAPRPEQRGGLPIAQLRKIEDYVRGHLAESIPIEALAELAGLSPFHFARAFKQATGMTPHQFVTRERMLRAQQLIRETSRSLIEIGLEVGYRSPSHFAQVFRREVGVAPTRFRKAF
jgi:AraC family transcriptional regulator